MESIQASVDWAKQKETGDSKADQGARLAYNFAFWNEHMFGEGGWDDNTESRNYGYFPEHNKRENMINLSLGGELEFVSKGGKYPNAGGTIALNYLEVPIYGIANHYFDNKNRVFAGIGPYFAYGIGGKVKGGGFEMSSFGENNGGYKRFDAGLTFLGGYQYREFRLSLNYDLGLANTAYANQDITSKGRSFGINLGYEIGHLFVKNKK